MHLTLVLSAFSLLIWGPVSERAEAATACTSTKALGCDDPSVDTILTPTELDCFTFSVADGTRVHIRVREDDAAASNIQPQWRVVTSQGAAATGCGTFVGSERDCGPLAASRTAWKCRTSSITARGPTASTSNG
jgi:hypothetical protein